MSDEDRTTRNQKELLERLDKRLAVARWKTKVAGLRYDAAYWEAFDLETMKRDIQYAWWVRKALAAGTISVGEYKS